MKIKIVKCSAKHYWYDGVVGHMVEVVQCPYDPSDWYCEEYSGSLLKSDCEVINETEAKSIKIKVVSCIGAFRWYHRHVGKVFEVERVDKYDFQYKLYDEEKYFKAHDVEIINETKESNTQERKPHKHAEVIRNYADGFTIQYRLHSGEQWTDIEEPAFDVDYQYRVKPEPEFPKTTLDRDNLRAIYHAVDCAYVHGNALEDVANEAIKTFITSGQMDEYIKERDNG